MSRVEKVNELRNLSGAELTQKEGALRKELQQLAQKKVSGQLDKPDLFKKTRRELARVMTIGREKKNV